MKLSKNFSLWELTKSQTAIRNGISNQPNAEHLEALKAVAQNILQPVRDHYGIPFTPSSGYRSPALNAIIPGSSNRSQHSRGQAVDFEVPGIANYDLALWIKENLRFDQLILEFYTPGKPNSGWVHCSYMVNRARHDVRRTQNGIHYPSGLKR